MRRSPAIETATCRLLRLCLAVATAAPFAAVASEEAASRFAPMEFLVGHCWRAAFADARTDVQCYEWLYDRALVRNTHSVDSDPPYRGLTIFSWDGTEERVRFHYFTSAGAVSDGYLLPAPDGTLVIPETHVDANGARIELETHMAARGPYAYTVRTRQRAGDDWKWMWDLEYRRLDAPDADRAPTSISRPDGEWRLAWSSRRDGGWNVYRREPDGTDLNLTPQPGDDWAWDARGERLVLLSKRPGAEAVDGWRAWQVRSDGVGAVQLDRRGTTDGTVTCTEELGRCLASIQVDGKRRIAELGMRDEVGRLLGSDAAEDADPMFSPDGRSLLFRSNRSGSWELWLGDAMAGDAKQLTSDPANDMVEAHFYNGEGPGRFSADGTRIVWTRRFPDRAFDVWSMRVDGSHKRNLTAAHAGSHGYPAFSPDGKLIAFDSDRDGDLEIYIMGTDGEAPRRVSFSPGTDLAPVWVRMPRAERNP